ncbi:MAG: hypothetical protein AAF985_23920 [Bacteroidota bacterium]
MNSLLPSSKTNFINPETAELEIKYLPGSPRIYRFDASRGIFTLAGETNLTKKGSAFSFTPVAYRLFTDDILGYGRKRWAEFFFVNDAGHLCHLMFHGYSVENLLQKTDDLYYDGVNLTQVRLTAKPIEKIKELPEGNNKYFIAEFSYQVLEKEEQQNVQQINKALKIWRKGTLTGDAEIELSIGYAAPFQHLSEDHKTDTQIPTKHKKAA